MLSIQIYYIHPHSSVHIFPETLRSDIHQGATRRPVTCRPGRHMASVLGRSSWPGFGRGGHGFFHGWIQKNIWRKPSLLPGFPSLLPGFHFAMNVWRLPFVTIVILCFFHVVFYQVFLWNTCDIYEIYELWAGFLHGFPSTNSFFYS
jgi:hypothetical protein